MLATGLLGTRGEGQLAQAGRRAGRRERRVAPRRRTARQRRVALAVGVAAVAGLLAAALVATVELIGRPRAAPPSTPLQARIVALATSQLGYQTDPPDSYCNRFSAYWGAGAGACGAGLRSEEWCADFAAWVWRKAGVPFVYGLAPGEIDAAAASFVLWGEQHGTWYPVGSGYLPQPGDVAVYGFDPSTLTAAHVAVVTGYVTGARGPDVVNGDGDQGAFSIIETATDQWKADPQRSGELLSGYVAPVRARPASGAGS